MDTSQKMPMIFIGHGSPMNAIEKNIYTESWKEIGKKIPKPKAILMLSAHSMTEHGMSISITEQPDMIYDMYGFPDELYRVSYPAKGSRKIANITRGLLGEGGFSIAPMDRGLDHGAWSTLIHLFPEADIPVVTMSLDYHMSPRDLVKVGAILSSLRDE
jgi:4,5-DOPA dioxygenase extradiol